MIRSGSDSSTRAFTGVEVVAGTVALLSFTSLLAPALRSVVSTSDRESCATNIHRVGAAMSQYTEDWDMRYPLAFTADASTGTWRYAVPVDGSKLIEFPNNWRMSQTAERWNENLTGWINAVFQYDPDFSAYRCPDGPEKFRTNGPADSGGLISDYSDPNPDAYPENSSYTYNGLLHGISVSAVVKPSQLALIWEGTGLLQVKGFGMSNPQTRCGFVSDPCTYIPYHGTGNCPISNSGASAVLFTNRPSRSYPSGSYWVHRPRLFALDRNGSSIPAPVRGMNIGMCDLSVKWRHRGAVYNSIDDEGDPYPLTDWSVDPYTGYGPSGFAGYAWSDGCWPWLFRPDYDFSFHP